MTHPKDAVYYTAYAVIVTAKGVAMLDNLFGSRLRARALGWLLTHPRERYYVRQLTNVLGEDSTNLSRELARLAQMGILVCEEEGRQKYYQVNRDSPVFEELRGLAVKTFAIADVVRKALGPLAKSIRVAFIYGSFANGSENAESDIDLAVVGSTSLSAVSKALRSAEEELGREINATIYPAREFRAKVEEGHHFVNAILTGEKIFLIGDRDDLAGLAGKPISE
ncbi:nucleotidyltransferase domain-containing protein [Candidatus Eisenbacteria bacterium]|uniref:Nucleotidyltransferase domain-containing protein n=1 Tax=Eiseniibacteriota bacterium TaxID=2212470 RepID=A0ABV6YMP0_UNCEI